MMRKGEREISYAELAKYARLDGWMISYAELAKYARLGDCLPAGEAGMG
jgi:hypothetical protein